MYESVMKEPLVKLLKVLSSSPAFSDTMPGNYITLYSYMYELFHFLRQTTTVSELDRIISDICDDDPAVNKVLLL